VNVVDANYNESNACAVFGELHSQCIPDAYGSALAPNQRLSYFYDSTAAFGYSRVILERCATLPPDAAWITYNPGVARKDCYFACKYGLGSGADGLQKKIKALQKSGMPTESDALPCVPKSVRLPKAWSGKGIVADPDGSWVDPINARTTYCDQNLKVINDAYTKANVFLAVDSLLTGLRDVCLPASNITGAVCDDRWHTGSSGGWSATVQANDPPPCALLAVNSAANGGLGISSLLNSEGVWIHGVLVPDPLSRLTGYCHSFMYSFIYSFI
jgi:hypothetical protein